MSSRAQAERILHIDEMALDKEWLGQAGLYFAFATELADARQKLDEAKAEMEVTEAEIDREIRLRPEQHGIDGRVTETAVKNAVLLHKKYREVQRQYIEAKHTVAIADAAISALDHRKKALENLVHLFSMNYFSQPSAKGEGRKAAEAIEHRTVRKPIRREA